MDYKNNLEATITKLIKAKKKATITLIVLIFCLTGVSTFLGFIYIDLYGKHEQLTSDYNVLMGDYNELVGEYEDLNETYYILTGEYIELQFDYSDLEDIYEGLENDYSNLEEIYEELENSYSLLLVAFNILNNTYYAFCEYINTLILPAQYMVFAEAVRRYYMPLYLSGTSKEWYMGYAEFCRDIILHDSWQENSFQDVSNVFSDCLRFGNNTMYLAFQTMYMVYWSWLPNWWGYGLSGVDNLTDINIVHQWCVDEIDYEYDYKIRYGQENETWDYPKFPVETAFRTMGDCEDQAILDSAYLESCGFETAVAISHDPDHPVYGSFYHGSLLVHIEDTTAFWAMYPACTLWNFGSVDPYEEYTWCWLDPTWNVPFGSVPSWLADYGGLLSFNDVSIAICDIDGNIGVSEISCEI